MGSWNGTCGLTQMAIQRGEEVVCYIIAENAFYYRKDCYGGGFSYSKDLFKPVAIPIVGQYDEYGGLMNVDSKYDVVLEAFIDAIQSENVKIEEGKEPDSIEKLIRYIQEGKVYLSVGDKKFMLGLMMFHKEIHDKLVKHQGKTEGFWSCAPKLKDMHEQVAEWMISKTEMMYGEMDDTLRAYSLPRANFRRHYLVKEKPGWVKESVITMMLMNDILETNRRFWHPQCGAGNPDIELKETRIIAKWMMEKVKDIINDLE